MRTRKRSVSDGSNSGYSDVRNDEKPKRHEKQRDEHASMSSWSMRPYHSYKHCRWNTTTTRTTR